MKLTRLGLAQGLMLLGLLGLALSAVLLALDWAAFEDRSNAETLALCGSVALVALGGWLARSPRLALEHALGGVLIAGAFLTLAYLFARFRNPHFFPRRSQVLLELAAVASLLAAVGLYLLRRLSERAPQAFRRSL